MRIIIFIYLFFYSFACLSQSTDAWIETLPSGEVVYHYSLTEAQVRTLGLKVFNGERCEIEQHWCDSAYQASLQELYLADSVLAGVQHELSQTEAARMLADSMWHWNEHIAALQSNISNVYQRRANRYSWGMVAAIIVGCLTTVLYIKE